MSLSPAAAELACRYRTGNRLLVLSILTTTRITPCDVPNLAFLFTYDLILWLLLAATKSVSSTYTRTLR